MPTPRPAARLVHAPAVAAALTISVGIAAGQRLDFVQPLTFEQAIERAMSANPRLAAARLRRAINLANIDVARQRPNPEARIELERETPRQAFGMTLPLETAAKRSRRIAVSEAALHTGEAELAETILAVRSSVRRAYFTRAAADARLTLLDELRGLAGRARDAAQARFEAGSAPRLELVQAQLVLAQTENDARAARATSEAARVTLNALLGFALDAPTVLASTLDPTAAPTGDAALALARASNTELAVLDRQIEEARARIDLARALQTPDVTAEGQFTRDAEPEFSAGWRAAAAVEIPVFTHRRAGVRVEEAALAQLRAERAATLTRISGEIVAAAALVEAQRDQAIRYRDQILPQAIEVERMAQDAYQLGQTGIAALLQALQATRDARLRAVQAAADFQSALADLERAIGAPIP